MTRIINLYTRTNVARKVTQVSSDDTIESALTQAGVNIGAVDRITLNGSVVDPADMDMTLDEFGIEGDDVHVGAVAAKDNAAC